MGEWEGEGGGCGTLLLHPEGVRGLRVEVCCILVLFGAAAEQTEAATCTLQCLVCLRSLLLAVDYVGEDAEGVVFSEG